MLRRDASRNASVSRGGAAVALLAAILGLSAVSPPARAQGATVGDDPPRYRIGGEVRLGFRSSDDERFPSPFPFPPDFLPPGATQGFMASVDPGDHFEVQVATLWAEGAWGRRWSGRLKLDFVDLYDRNPTSNGADFDIDEAWLRWGEEMEPAVEAPGYGVYLKLGKFGKLERQDDRHLESYGLVSTTFNRFEDVGLEVGFDLGRHVYIKSTVTQGNPVFLRDPNALAGDNGVPGFDGSVPNPIPEYGTGLVILYDTDVDEIDFENPEVGLGVGWRRAGSRVAIDLLGWAYRRDLAESVDLFHTFYDGDLDLLLGPGNGPFRLPVSGDEKRELGANLWLYAGGFSLFAQAVDAELAGLDRTAWEAEVAYAFDLPLRWAAGGRQLFPYVAPAVRYSRLEPDFASPNRYPAPSVTWEWEKLDFGVRLGLWDGIDLTAEYQDNSFVRLGRTESNDELLVTLRLGTERGFGRR